MRVLRLLTAGESHGQALVGILEGMPAGLPLEAAYIDAQLARRQRGHGRGGRQKIEKDQVEILSGVRHGRTLGSPIALLIRNRDWRNWQEAMRVEPGGDEDLKAIHVPRPGHADYAGAVKYGHEDLRNVLERASARETAARVAVASVARRLLDEFGIAIVSRVVSIGDATDATPAEELAPAAFQARADRSIVRALDGDASARMVAAIDAAKQAGDSLGGIFEVRAFGLPIGLGSHVHWDRRLDGDLAAAFMSLNAIKGVEIGLGCAAARAPGSAAHDEFQLQGDRIERPTNRAGGLEGGMTTGQPLIIRAAMKPLATLMRPLASVDLAAREPAEAHVERSDVCAVVPASVIGEALAALVLADALLVKYGGDSVAEIRARYPAAPGS